jgi:hypothetical protein
MVAVLAWALVSLVVAVALLQLAVALRTKRSRQAVPPPDRLTYTALIKLHAVRQRLSVSQYRTQVKRDGARARRALQVELRQWEQWEDR